MIFQSDFRPRAISCSNVHGVCPVHERFWFCLIQVSTTQFCYFPSFLMARVSDGTNVPISPAPASYSNMGSPNDSLPDLEGPGFRSSEPRGHSSLSCRTSWSSLPTSCPRFRSWICLWRRGRGRWMKTSWWLCSSRHWTRTHKTVMIFLFWIDTDNTSDDGVKKDSFNELPFSSQRSRIKSQSVQPG